MKPGETVIQVGTGMGYFTAILAELVGPTGSVRAFEIDPVVEVARERLKPWPWVQIEARSGVTEHQPADVVYAFAAVEQLPHQWIAALRPGGRLVVPIAPRAREGGILLAERRDRGYPARFVVPARFIPCIGATEEAASMALVEAFARGDMDSVRSLRVAPEKPDESCWFAGSDWWLSRSPSL